MVRNREELLMFLTKELRKEILKMFLGLLVMCTVMVAVVYVAGRGGISVVLGSLLGMVIAFLNYYLLAVTISLSCNDDISKAKGYMGLSYPIRILIMAIAIIFAIRNPYFNYVTTAIPLLFPRILIYFFNLSKMKKKTESKEVLPAEGSDTVITETEV